MSSEDPKLKKLKQVVKGKILIDELLREHTSFKIGGITPLFIEEFTTSFRKILRIFRI